MQIHRIRGKNLREALERARTIHGEEALVLTHESTPTGDVMVAVGGGRAEAATETVVRAMPRGEVAEKGLADVLRRLAASGTSQAWMNEIGARVRASGARGAYTIDAAAEALADFVPLAPSPKADGTTHVMAFVGAAGVGKTTTLVKLAVRLVKSRRRLALLSLGTQRADAKRDLASYAKLLQVPCTSLVEAGQLEPWMSTSARCDAVLVDTAGRGERDVEWVRELARTVEHAPLAAKLETYLVLAGDGTAAELKRTIRAHRDARPSACVITRLDLARSPAVVLEAAAQAGLPLAFLADGPEVSRHLRRASADAVCDLFLRGRLA